MSCLSGSHISVTASRCACLLTSGRHSGCQWVSPSAPFGAAGGLYRCAGNAATCETDVSRCRRRALSPYSVRQRGVKVRPFAARAPALSTANRRLGAPGSRTPSAAGEAHPVSSRGVAPRPQPGSLTPSAAGEARFSARRVARGDPEG